MQVEHREKLRAHICELVQDLVIDHMFEALLLRDNILTFEHVERIVSLNTTADKAFEVCMLLPKRGPLAFPILIEALMKTGQEHLATLLDQDLSKQWEGSRTAASEVWNDSPHMNDLTDPEVCKNKKHHRTSEVHLALTEADGHAVVPVSPVTPEARENEFSNRRLSISLSTSSTSLNTADELFPHRSSNASKPKIQDYLYQGNVEMVTRMLEGGFAVNETDERGLSLLYIAASQGQISMSRTLLEHNADVTWARPVAGDTPLHAATRGKHGYVASILIRHNAPVNSVDSQGFTPLHFASFVGLYSTVHMLLQKDAPVNAATNERLSVLHAAVEGGNLNIVKVLIESGTKVNAQDNEGWTPTHVAACWGREEILTLLLDNGALTNAITRDGQSLLHLAAHSGSPACLRKVLDQKTNVNIKDNRGLRPLNTAVQDGHIECVRLLLKYGAHASPPSAPITPLHQAAYNKHIVICEDLLAYGADISARTPSGLSVLHAAAYGGAVDIAQLFLQHGADISARTNDDWSVLHAAARGGRHAVAERLLEAGADVEAHTSSGQSVLQAAVLGGDVHTARLLLDSHATLDVQDITWWQILRDLNIKGRERMMKFLLEEGTRKSSEKLEKKEISRIEENGITPL